MGCVLHLFNAAVDFPGVGRELFTDSLDEGPGEHVGWGTLDANRVDNLIYVRM